MPCPLKALVLMLVLVPSVVESKVLAPGSNVKAWNDAKMVGIALKIYAEENGGKLPDAFEQLFPNFIFDSSRYDHTTLTVPGAILDDLSDDAIIAVRLFPEDGRYAVAIYSTTTVKPIKASPWIGELPGQRQSYYNGIFHGTALTFLGFAVLVLVVRTFQRSSKKPTEQGGG